MTQRQNDGFDPTDPIGAWRAIRDANLDAWSKGMASMVNTEAFANAIGMQLDTMLAASAPIQKAVQQAMESYLAQAQLPSRAEVVSLAQRLTNIELRLDDMQAQIEDVLAALRAAPEQPTALPAPVSHIEQQLTAMQGQLDTILGALQQAPPPTAPRRLRRPTED